ncbi:MAG: Rieske 2Fe-2S domain-containing protein [Bacteroidetes bacterium]|nr:MAG: Rieske 2Fe-2S domain-containing protein [Bacteroidota bacterium]
MSESEKLTWHKIAERIGEIQFAPNNIACVEVAGKKICIGKFRGQVFAFAYQCPHAGGFLDAAEIDKSGNLVCPMHQYKFDMKNGRNVSGEGYYLRHWPIELRTDGIYIGMTLEAFE